MRLPLTIYSSLALLLYSMLLGDPPATFDLRDFGGYNYVTSIKNQSGGTCWTHGAMAAMEGNLLMTGNWLAAGETGEPNLAEYHLDWWNGFNEHNNDDVYPPIGDGLTVHQGGDYLVTAAYLSRGEGAVRDIDGQSFAIPPLRIDPSFHHYYPRDIIWLSAGSNLSNINVIKEALMNYGAVGTCLCYSEMYINNFVHYQPRTSPYPPNHAVTIIGWDDNKITQALEPGAWLCKNSWGGGWGESGCFWISYYDKHSCQEPFMGAVSFQDVDRLAYDKVYYHDYHGWRDTRADCQQAFNAFIADGFHEIKAVNFYTAADSVDFIVIIYDDFIDNELQNVISTVLGFIEFRGFHTVDLPSMIGVNPGEDFYLYLNVNKGGQAYDRTSDVPVLLGASYKTIVTSSAEPGQSFYHCGVQWNDLYDEDNSANFCMKALAETNPPLLFNFHDQPPLYLNPGEATSVIVQISDKADTYIPGTAKLYYRNQGEEFIEYNLLYLEEDYFETILPPTPCFTEADYYFSAETPIVGVVYYPDNAPENYIVAEVGEVITLWHDDFDNELGWTSEIYEATGGEWQRGIPVNDPEWPYAPTTDADGNGQCYLTQNEMGGETDVNDGAVALLSPVFEMDQYSSISYDYYLYLSSSLIGIDYLAVSISSDGGFTWTEIARHDQYGAQIWYHQIITADQLADAGVIAGGNMQVCFLAIDDYPQSVVEVAVDNFSVQTLSCDAYECGDVNRDSMVNIGDAVFLLNHIFHEGPEPSLFGSSDINCDMSINIGDAVYLLNHIFKNAPRPCTSCPK